MRKTKFKHRDNVFAVVNLNSEDFYWMFRPEEKVSDKFVAVEAMVCHEDEQNLCKSNETSYILEGGEYGVFAAPENHLFKTPTEAKAFLRECERERTIHLFKESSTMHGLLRFLVETNSLQIPSDIIARDVLYTHLEDAGLGDRIPLYEMAAV